jgi:SAM-dependent methyltransferase
MAADWYFDEQLWKEFYSCMFSPAQFELAEEQVEQITSLIGRQPERVLDLACGPGRHTLPLLRNGCKVTAVDTSPFLMNDLMQRLDAESLQADVVHADMRSFRRDNSFDLAVCLWSSFGYFEAPEDDRKVLTNIFNSLRDNGQFIIDTVGKEYMLRQLEPVHVREFDDGGVLFERPQLVNNCSRIINDWTLVRDGEVFRTSFSHTVYSAVELQDRLFAAGFTSVAVYGDLGGSEFDADSDRLVVVAGK